MVESAGITRRTALKALAATGVTAGIAGCVGAGSETTEEDSQDDDTGGGELTDVVLLNDHNDEQELHLLVYRGEERIHWETHELSPGFETALDDLTVEHDASAADYTLVTRLADADSWEEWTIDIDGSDCVEIMIRIDSSGAVGTWSNTDACP